MASAIVVPFSAMLTHIGPSTTRAVRERGGRRMRRASGGSMPTARAGAASVSRLIHRIWVASSGVTMPSLPLVSPSTPANTMPRNIVMTSPVFDDKR